LQREKSFEVQGATRSVSFPLCYAPIFLPKSYPLFELLVAAQQPMWQLATPYAHQTDFEDGINLITTNLSYVLASQLRFCPLFWRFITSMKAVLMAQFSLGLRVFLKLF
jgi:hypothetical protein